ncbi:hypothetical protein [Mesorhizobium caraganae]|uniref:hypothetical protein n=1 Tax=Mesorhizobium caraganae TaxID=483206 RepID=UPI003339E6F6
MTYPNDSRYGAVVAYIGPRCRVIVDERGWGWNLQTRAKRGTRVVWNNKTGLLRSRSNLARIIPGYLHSSYMAEEGITQEFIDRTLQGTMPDTFTEAYGHKVLAEGGVIRR